MLKLLTLIATICITISANNDIRTVQLFQTDINDSSLSRIKNSNYNYVIVPFIYRISDTVVGNGDIYENLSADICSLTIVLSKYNLKIIPMIPMSSKWALNWKTIQIFENPKVGMNTIVANDNNPNILNAYGIYTALNTLRGGNDGTEDKTLCDIENPSSVANMGSNSWAEEKEGVDKSVVDIFNAIKKGFNKSKVNYALEYVHIEHDEPQFLNWSLIGGAALPCGNAYPYKGNFARGEVSSADTLYIINAIKSGMSVEKAYQSLLADEIYRRVIQSEQVFGSSVKLMFFAEAFDNQSWGGVEWYVKNGKKASKIYMGGVIELPNLTEVEKRKVKDQTVLVLWNYDGKRVYEGSIVKYLNRKDYNTDYAFQRLSDYGFNFLYIGAFQNGKSSKNQIRESAVAAEKYRDHCVGFYAAAWDAPYIDAKWDVIEYLASEQKKPCYSSSHIESVRFINGSISFKLGLDNFVKISVYDMSGKLVQKVCSEVLPKGYHSFTLNRSSAMYVAKIVDGNSLSVKNIVLVK